MKHNQYLWGIGISRLGVALWRSLAILISALALIGADAPAPEPDSADTDGDGMSDAFEQFYWLDYRNAQDALLDYDGDHLLNVREAVLGTDPYERDTDFDGATDDVDGDPLSRCYLRWGWPRFTDGDHYEYAHADFFQAAWKEGGDWWVVDSATTQSAWHVASTEAPGVGSLSVALDRSILTNNLKYAVHYWSAGDAELYVALLATKGAVIIEDLYGNLMRGSNTEATVLLDIPTARYPDAAVIQLWRGKGEVTVCEGLVYIDEDGDNLDQAGELQNSTSDDCIDSDGDGVNDYDEWLSKINGGDLPPPIPPTPPDDDDPGKPTGIIYVDQKIGSDSLTGRAPVVSGDDGPKKTVGKGLAAVEEDRAHTLVIKSGAYQENLDIHGKALTVVIEGKVGL